MIDPLKLNLTESEAAQLLKEMTDGKIFEDGSYIYRIYPQRFNPYLSTPLIITIMNTPDEIGADLFIFVAKRIHVILRNFQEIENCSFYIHKLWLDEFEHEINFKNMIFLNPAWDHFKIKDAEKTLQVACTTYSMKEFNNSMTVRKAKLEKFVKSYESRFLPEGLELAPGPEATAEFKKLEMEPTPVLPVTKKLISIRNEIHKTPGLNLSADFWVVIELTTEPSDQIKTLLDKPNTINNHLLKSYATASVDTILNSYISDIYNKTKFYLNISPVDLISFTIHTTFGVKTITKTHEYYD